MKTPLPGEWITVLAHGRVLRVKSSGPSGPGRSALLCWYGHIGSQYDRGAVDLADEGTTWARGWETEDARALQALHALVAE